VAPLCVRRESRRSVMWLCTIASSASNNSLTRVSIYFGGPRRRPRYHAPPMLILATIVAVWLVLGDLNRDEK
jgi:hypothetical protein